jgi:hypothetical protein
LVEVVVDEVVVLVDDEHHNVMILKFLETL